MSNKPDTTAVDVLAALGSRAGKSESTIEQLRRRTGVDFTQLNKQDQWWSMEIAKRWSRIVRDYQKENPRDNWIEPDSQQAFMDVMVAHIRQPCDLFAWLLADDLRFRGAMVHLMHNIDRPCAQLRPGCRLHFARVTS